MKFLLDKLYEKNVGEKIYTALEPVHSQVIHLYETTTKFDIDVDRPYYEMVEAMLDHQIHLFAEMGWTNIRSIYITNNDCIPLIMINFSKAGVMRLKVCQRSFDIGKHKHNDVMFFFDYAKRLADRLNEDEHFQRNLIKEIGEFKKITDIIVDWSCEFPHVYTEEECDRVELVI